MLSKSGIATNPRKVEDIKNWSWPKTVTHVQRQKRRSGSYRHDKGMAQESKEDGTENEQYEVN